MAAKTATGSVSKSASSNSNSSKNIAAGGQVYDRTTGTWEGRTKGSLGDGKNHHQGGETKVWRDANGIVGVERVGNQVLQKAQTAGSGSERVTTPGASPKGAGGTGAGSHMVTIGGPAAGGAGPGSLGVSGGGKLKPYMNPEVTEVMVGGDWWKSNPWFSDAQEWTTRYGEGEVAETIFFLITSGADIAHNIGSRVGPAIGGAAGRLHNGLDNSWVSPDTPVFNPDANWGR